MTDDLAEKRFQRWIVLGIALVLLSVAVSFVRQLDASVRGPLSIAFLLAGIGAQFMALRERGFRRRTP